MNIERRYTAITNQLETATTLARAKRQAKHRNAEESIYRAAQEPKFRKIALGALRRASLSLFGLETPPDSAHARLALQTAIKSAKAKAHRMFLKIHPNAKDVVIYRLESA